MNRCEDGQSKARWHEVARRDAQLIGNETKKNDISLETLFINNQLFKYIGYYGQDANESFQTTV